MDLVVIYEPKQIVEFEQNYAVFRTLEMRDKYESNLKQIKGYYVMTGSVYHCDWKIHLLFSELGFRYSSLKNIKKIKQPIMFLRQNRRINASYIEEAYEIRCRIKNVLNVDNLRTTMLRKGRLHLTIPNTVETLDWKDFSYTEGVWIVKLDRKTSYQGADNFIITNENEWLEKREMIEKMMIETEKKKQQFTGTQEEIDQEMEKHSDTKFLLRGAIVSRYITNPMLSKDGRKCHFRPYIMLRSWDKCVISPFALFITALLPYENKDFNNPNIHDSHLSKTDRVDLISDEAIISKIKGVCQPLMDVLDQQYLTMYIEAQFGYQIFAPDVLFDDNGNAYILEVNTTPGQGDLTKEGIVEYENIFSEWEFNNGILPNLQ